MASISRDSKGWRVQWMRGGKRVTLRLGRVSERTAGYIARHVEALVMSRRNGAPPDGATAGWVGGLDDEMHARLADLGLVQPRATVQTVTLGAMLTACMDAADVKPATRVR